MQDLVASISLNRYLIVWRVTSPVVILPRFLPGELISVLGKFIVMNLPNHQVREWRKALSASPVRWPLEAVFFVPHLSPKRAYGKDELIIWELKLLGEHADHGIFLEMILPAMEKASNTMDYSLRGTRNMWGRFDIEAIYSARGRNWEPFVEKGKLNTNYHPSSAQWAEGLALGESTQRGFHYLHWITPFEFSKEEENDPAAGLGPSLTDIISALVTRMTVFFPSKSGIQRVHDVWECLSLEERSRIQWALQQPESQALVQQETLQNPPKDWPGHKVGTQTFRDILPPLLPYLDLASILHVGEQAHYGCGTFILT